MVMEMMLEEILEALCRAFAPLEKALGAELSGIFLVDDRFAAKVLVGVPSLAFCSSPKSPWK